MKKPYAYNAAFAFLAVLGIRNLFHEASYFVQSWQELHSQWIGHAYMALMLLLSWLGYVVLAAVVASCFIGLFFIKEGDSPMGLVGKTVGWAFLSLVVPSFAVLLWFAFVAVTHSLFEKIL